MLEDAERGMNERLKVLLAEELHRAREMEKTPMPKGQFVGGTYVAANPLEFAAATMERIRGGAEAKKILGERPSGETGQPITRYGQASRRRVGRGAFMQLLQKLLGGRTQFDSTGHPPEGTEQTFPPGPGRRALRPPQAEEQGRGLHEPPADHAHRPRREGGGRRGADRQRLARRRERRRHRPDRRRLDREPPARGEPRLAATGVYLAAAPAQADHFELGLLEENLSGPTVEEEREFVKDVISWKVRHVFGVKGTDWRGIVKAVVT